MHMQRPTAQLEKLKSLVGQWSGEETMHPSPWDPKGGPARSKTLARMELDGSFVFADYEQERGGTITYRGKGVYGYDTFQNKYTMHWFDTMSCDPGPPALGVWEGDRLTFVHQHPMGFGRFTYVFQGTDAYSFKLENSRDGQNWSTFLEGTYQRVS
jgi:hypothetical protein